MNISQITSNLRSLIDELSELEEKPKSQNTLDEIAELVQTARIYPISNHILAVKDSTVQARYVTALIAIVEALDDNSARRQQLLLINRIIASYEDEINFEEYMLKSRKLYKNYWVDLIEFFDRETKFFFSIDMMISVMLSTECDDEKKYSLISDILQAFDFTNEDVKKIAIIAKSVIEQDFNALLKQFDETDGIDYNFLFGYYYKMDYSIVFGNFSDVFEKEGKVLIANAVIQDYNALIDLDEQSKAQEIRFYNCKFKAFNGIKSNLRNVVFENCKFDTVFDEYTYCTAFIEGSNLKFYGCYFKNLKVERRMLLDLKASELVNCKFSKCEGSNTNGENLFRFDNCRLSHCSFIRCVSEDGCTSLMHIESTVIQDCLFDKCKYNPYCTWEGKYGSIVLAVNSKVADCSFKMCEMGADLDYCVILRISETEEENNSFEDNFGSYGEKLIQNIGDLQE